jgi:hypothetical protein
MCLFLFGIWSTSWAATIRFDERGTDPLVDVNGLHIQGVLFSFSPDQLAGSTSAGGLTIAFDFPTTTGDALDTAIISVYGGVDGGGSAAPAFGLDNLTYNDLVTDTPEPPTFFGLGAGLLVIGTMKRRTHSR